MADDPRTPDSLSREQAVLKKLGQGMRERLEPVVGDPQPKEIAILLDKLRAKHG